MEKKPAIKDLKSKKTFGIYSKKYNILTKLFLRIIFYNSLTKQSHNGH